MRAGLLAFTIALSSPFLLHSSQAEPVDVSLSGLCEDVLERYSATAEESFRAITSKMEKNAARVLENELSLARFPLLRTLTDFFVFLLKSDQHQSFHSRSASALAHGGRSDWVRVLAADPDVPGQRWAIQQLSFESKEPNEGLFFSIIESALPHYEARRAAVSALRSRFWKMDEAEAKSGTLRLLGLLKQEQDRGVAREMTIAILYKGSATPPDVLQAVADYCRDPSSAYAPEMVWSLSLLTNVPEVRLLILDLTQAPSLELREQAMTALGRSKGADAAALLETRILTIDKKYEKEEGIRPDRYKNEDRYERSTALSALVSLAQIGDQAAFESLVKLLKAGNDSGLALVRVVSRWNPRRPPEWVEEWSMSRIPTWSAILHAWVDILDGGDRSTAMDAFERVWDILPARDSDATTFSQLGLVWDEDVSLPEGWRNFSLMFGIGVSQNSSVRRIRKPTEEQKTLFHQKINEYIEFLEDQKVRN